MFTPIQLSKAKAVPIVDVLASRGVLPVTQTGQEMAYRSPLTDERSPSLFVNAAKNVFTDYSGQQQGDVVRLVQVLTGCSFRLAVEFLLNFEGPSQPPAFSFSGPLPAAPGVSSLTVTDVRRLSHPALLRYVTSRQIPATLAVAYCREVYYEQKGGRYFAVGFANDCGGWELRTERFKGSSAPKGVSTFDVPGSNRVCLFEGFFDFLSALAWYGLTRPRHTSVVVNSTVNLTQALPRLREAGQINSFLDDDRAGRAAVERLRREGLPVVDSSAVYAGWKDFNEMLCARR